MCGSLQCADYVTEVPSHLHTAGTILYGSHGTSDDTCKYAIVLMDPCILKETFMPCCADHLYLNHPVVNNLTFGW